METLVAIPPKIAPKGAEWFVGKIVKVQGLDFKIKSIGPRGRIILKVAK
jgi:hypothetical protein